jgi:hypothetical protein
MRFLFLFLLVWLCVHCQNKRTKILYAKPKALGKWLEIGVVMPDTAWYGRQGAFIREYLAQTKTYTYLHISPEDTVHFAGLHRNLWYVSPLYVGKFRQEKDQRAFGQTAQYFALLPTDTATLEKALAYVWKQEKERVRDYKYTLEEGQATALEKWVGKRYPFKIRILPEFQVWQHSPTSLWLKTDRGAEQHIYIAKSAQPNPQLLPKVPHLKNIEVKTNWHKGYQMVFLATRSKENPALQRLEMEAIVDTFQ